MAARRRRAPRRRPPHRRACARSRTPETPLTENSSSSPRTERGVWCAVAGLLDLQARHRRVQATRAEQEALDRQPRLMGVCNISHLLCLHFFTRWLQNVCVEPAQFS
jgi:hypothetical protein